MEIDIDLLLLGLFGILLGLIVLHLRPSKDRDYGFSGMKMWSGVIGLFLWGIIAIILSFL